MATDKHILDYVTVFRELRLSLAKTVLAFWVFSISATGIHNSEVKRVLHYFIMKMVTTVIMITFYSKKADLKVVIKLGY